jgi:CBS domain-containing protein
VTATSAAAPARALRDLMTTRVATTTPDASVAAAAAVMVAANVGSAVVMQGPFLAGILTERDVLRSAASGRDLAASTVSEWMTPDPQSVSPDASAQDAAEIMFRHGFRHLPVVDGRTVCGVVSLRDLFAARIRRPQAG